MPLNKSIAVLGIIVCTFISLNSCKEYKLNKFRISSINLELVSYEIDSSKCLKFKKYSYIEEQDNIALEVRISKNYLSDSSIYEPSLYSYTKGTEGLYQKIESLDFTIDDRHVNQDSLFVQKEAPFYYLPRHLHNSDGEMYGYSTYGCVPSKFFSSFENLKNELNARNQDFSNDWASTELYGEEMESEFYLIVNKKYLKDHFSSSELLFKVDCKVSSSR